MLAYLAGDGLTRMRRGLQRLANPSAWMDPFLERAAVIVHDHNRMNLMMGRSFTGATFDKVKRKHGGPPLLERQYRAINLAVVVPEQTGWNTFEIIIAWPQFKTDKGRDILSMHMKAYEGRPARPAVGIPESAKPEIRAEWRRFTGRELREFTNAPSVEVQPGRWTTPTLSGRR